MGRYISMANEQNKENIKIKEKNIEGGVAVSANQNYSLFHCH